MTSTGIRKWGTLGANDSERGHSQSGRKPIDRFVTSLFSRFGVGSKAALFYLGPDIKITSRTKGSKFVSFMELNAPEMKQVRKLEVDKTKWWDSKVKNRAPNPKLKGEKWESFTRCEAFPSSKPWSEEEKAYIISGFIFFCPFILTL